MLAQIEGLRLFALMSLCHNVFAFMSCALLYASFCLRSYVGFRA